jgi:hypothetical protein
MRGKILFAFVVGLTPVLVQAQTATAPVPAWVDIHNQMAKNYRLVEATLTLDGRTVAQQKAAEGQELQPTFRAFEGSLTPGSHGLTAVLVFEGRNRGLFTYLDDYTYRTVAAYSFVVPEPAQGSERAAPAGLDVVATEKKGPNVAFDKKLQIDFRPEPGSAIPAPQHAPR